MSSRVTAKFLRVPPRKVRLVADLVRGKDANAATAILKNTTAKSAKMIDKVIKSAVANLTSAGKVNVDRLYVRELSVDAGPIIKRFTARAQGRGTRVNKRTSHVTVVVDER